MEQLSRHLPFQREQLEVQWSQLLPVQSEYPLLYVEKQKRYISTISHVIFPFCRYYLEKKGQTTQIENTRGPAPIATAPPGVPSISNWEILDDGKSFK